MSPRHTGVRVGVAVVCAAVSAVLCWVVLTVWRGQGREFPLLPWFGLVPLVLVCVLVLSAAWRVRGSVRTVLPAPPSPQLARGTLVAAQACALGGALLLGWYAANVVVHVPDLDVDSVRGAAVRGAVSALAAAAVSVSGFLAQAWCVLPPRDPDDDPDTDRESDPHPDAGDLAYP